LDWTMLPRTKASALALLLIISALASVFLTTAEDRVSPVKAGISAFTFGVNVTVTDEAGRPIDGALVGIRDNSSGPWPTVAGSVLIDGLADNVTSYTLWANKTGYLNSVDTPVVVNVSTTANVTLIITGGSIWGFVTSQLGHVSSGLVLIDSLGYAAVVSSTDGTYALEGVPNGNYTVNASAPGYALDSKNLTVTAGKITRQDFALYSQEGWLSGYVFHSVTHLPLNDTNVSATKDNSTTTVPNNADGSYLIVGLPEGNYTVTASKDGFYTITLTDVFISNNGTSNFNFSLTEKPTLIYGTVRSGSYLQPNVNVSVVGTNVFNVSDAEGDYRLENLSAGVYALSAKLEGYELALISDVFLPVGGEVRVVIELVAMPGAIVRGQVLERDSREPISSVSVTIIASGGEQRSKDTNFKGQFEFTGLADGDYTLQFEMVGYLPLEVSKITVSSDTVSNSTYYLVQERQGFTGFIFGFDLAHSMMILALFVTIMILAAAVYLRIRTFQTPENAPAVYDQAEEEQTEEEKKDALADLESATLKKDGKKVRRKKEGGS
jgi:large repetitive protein